MSTLKRIVEKIKLHILVWLMFNIGRHYPEIVLNFFSKEELKKEVLIRNLIEYLDY